MKHDPFGNLTDWGSVLDLLEKLADNGKLSECQPGLVRILRYQGNWRLREEVLKRVGEIQIPSEGLISQVIIMLADDNLYYEARILSCDALIRLLKNGQNSLKDDVRMKVLKVGERLRNTPHPPVFEKALERLYTDYSLRNTLKN